MRSNKGLYRFALLTAIATFPLVFMGGLVTSRDAGLAVPDWPTSFGHNMFALPWGYWEGDVFFEHVHRLLGAVVGILTVILAFWIAFAEKRRSMRVLGWTALAAVCVQGVLGGLRVEWLKVELAVVHGCFAQAYFSLLMGMVVLLSRGWKEAPEYKARPEAGLLRASAIALTGVVFLQLVFGAMLRHLDRMLVPHIFLALGVVAMVFWVFWQSHFGFRDAAKLTRLSKVLMGLVAGQILLGIGALLAVKEIAPLDRFSGWHTLLPTLHVAVGALILAHAVLFSLWAFRVPKGVGQAFQPAVETR